MGLLISLFLILRYLLLQHLVTCLPSSSSSPHQLCPQDQMDALIQFKLMFAVSDMASWRCNYFGTPYPKTQSWNERNPDCCTWDGVWCHGFTGNVIGLDLSCSKLYGSIHQNSSLFRLSHLQQLNLAYNDFTESPILPAFGHFPSLTHLNLSFSNFIGSIPSEISHLSNLVSLDLSSASLRLEPYIFKMMLENLTTLQALVLEGVSISSALPSSLMNLSSLVSLNLRQTELQGNLLSDILYLPKLEELYLSNNFDLTGSFPEKNWSRNSSLKIISLSYTSLSGELDDSIGNLRSLNYLDLSYCKFFGPITALLGNLMQVSQLDLSGNNFTGQIPSTLSKLEHLTKLSLSGNNLEGQIPSAFAKLTRLELLDLSNNRLSGPFPQWTANLTKIINLELSDNLLTGPIPQKINGFQVLQFLSLSNNLLNGTIPPQLFTLPALLIIDLSYNQLTGQFPEFPENSSLQHIALSNNKLHGPIPQSISSLVNLIDLLLSSNNLGGFLDLHMFSNLKQLQDLDLSGNNLSVIPGSNGNTNFPNLYLLGLSSCNLKQFPDVLRNLENLGSLDLSHNNLHGNIPEWFGEIGNSTLQYLILSHNFLTGIGQLPWKCLTILDLSFNKFHGQLPVPPLTTMYFSVSHNELMGEIPSFICGVRQLKFLDLSHNNLSGAIPHCLANFSNGLSVLDLQSNGFQGKIPLTFAKGNMLRSLHLNDNELEGPVPQSLTNCRHLEVLDLGNNKINDTFPYWLGTLPKLQVLILRSNRFHSAIDTSKAKQAFPMLGILDLSYNNFVGPLPGRFFKNFKARACQEARYMGNRYYNDSVQLTIKGDDIHMGRILTILTTIDLSSNKFSGEIASTFQMLSSLIVLNLSHNSLTGHIPASIGDLTILESLDLSSNQLVGEIPKALTRLTFLEVLNLSWNHLVGPIPTGKQFDTFQNDSYAGNMGLCGFPLSNECKDNQAQPQLISQHDNGSNSASGLTLESVVLGYWGGLPLGLLIGLLMFPTGRLKFWFRKVGVKHAKKKGFLKIGYKQSARRNKREYHFRRFDLLEVPELGSQKPLLREGS